MAGGTARRPGELLVLSADTREELDGATRALADELASRPTKPLADVAGELQLTRPALRYRRVVEAADTTAAVRLLRRPLSTVEKTADPAVVFLFPGVGDHHAGMGRDLYRHEPVFRHWLDRSARFLARHCGLDLLPVLYPSDETGREPGRIDLAGLLGRGDGSGPLVRESALDDTRVAQPLVFAVEHALAKLLLSWGIRPAAMAGYSIGEYVAATLAGVFSLEDALTVVARRAELIETVPPGAMLVVMLGSAELAARLDDELSLAAVDGATLCVAAGPHHAVERLEKLLTADGVASVRATTRHAFHSAMMAPVERPLAELVRSVRLRAPSTPLLSNVSGTWLRADEATSPGYWARHLSATVRFHDELTELWRQPGAIALEVGAGRMLGGLAAQHPGCPRGAPPVQFTLPGATAGADVPSLAVTAGRLWQAGVPVDWSGFRSQEGR
ncbi:acyltransferase domain-containing protein [Amycolatopsis sp. NPDC049252]|uniref:acyltransferase domain-containing protein n=1 Tax=Amycolatopsis sp. NPDC049252 TaxID=3363933 RepID=UPI003722D041